MAPAQENHAPEAIGRRLRDLYDDVVNEPVPDDFMDLLAKLDDTAGDDGDEQG
ncbi:NepR family anti-sigma factor [Maricaulis sp.]|uniref:NepR family anti-sigma factor n=1 Tax=Maricaulis sp. TaxID=1486257 RepID=UPI003A921099